MAIQYILGKMGQKRLLMAHLYEFGISMFWCLLCRRLTCAIESTHCSRFTYFQKLKIQEEEVRKAIQALLKQTSPTALMANFVVMVLVPALGEELFFRGILQKLFQRNFNLRFAVVATSLCFAVAHQQPLSFIPLFFMGILLSYAKYWTGSLWAAILLHSINNGFALFSSYAAGGELQYESTMDIN